jgi:integrase
MTKTVPSKIKRKGGRKPVSFVVHPDSGDAVEGLRLHRSSSRYYRITEDKKTRHFYVRGLRTPAAYLRRAISEHESWRQGTEPPPDLTTVEVIGETGYDDFGSPLPTTASFIDGRPATIQNLKRSDLIAWLRQEFDTTEGRAALAAELGIPELRNLENIPDAVKPLTLATMIDEYISHKSFSRKSQYTDAQNAWEIFSNKVKVQIFDEITNASLQTYKRDVEDRYALRSQINNYNAIQSILTHASDIHPEHRIDIENLKGEIKRNVQKWSPDKKKKSKKGGAKALKSSEFRKLLASAKKESKLAYALYLAAANFALHGKEATEIRHEDIDLDAMTLYSKREKDGIERAAILWTETAAAIKSYKSETDTHPEFLFVVGGQPINIKRVNRLHKKMRDALGMDSSVKFDGIRKLTRTSMGASNVIAVKWVMGHAMSGEDDTYVGERDPQETRAALMKARKAILGK